MDCWGFRPGETAREERDVPVVFPRQMSVFQETQWMGRDRKVEATKQALPLMARECVRNIRPLEGAKRPKGVVWSLRHTFDAKVGSAQPRLQVLVEEAS